MHIALTPELTELINSRLSSGQYRTPGDVLREALLLLEEHDTLDRARIERLRREVDEGLAQLDAGEGIDGAEVFARLRQRSASRRSEVG